MRDFKIKATGLVASYAFLEIGHASNNIYLQLGLSVVSLITGIANNIGVNPLKKLASIDEIYSGKLLDLEEILKIKEDAIVQIALDKKEAESKNKNIIALAEKEALEIQARCEKEYEIRIALPVKKALQAEVENLENLKLQKTQDIQVINLAIDSTRKEIEAMKQQAQQEYDEKHQQLISNAEALIDEATQQAQGVISSLQLQLEMKQKEIDYLTERISTEDQLTRAPKWGYENLLSREVQTFYENKKVELNYHFATSLGEEVLLGYELVDENLPTSKISSHFGVLQRVFNLKEKPILEATSYGIQFRLKSLQNALANKNDLKQLQNSGISKQSAEGIVKSKIGNTANEYNKQPIPSNDSITEEDAKLIESFHAEIENFDSIERNRFPVNAESISHTEIIWVLHLVAYRNITNKDIVARDVWENSDGSDIKPGSNGYSLAIKKVNRICEEYGINI